jgi:hypothetical protein
MRITGFRNRLTRQGKHGNPSIYEVGGFLPVRSSAAFFKDLFVTGGGGAILFLTGILLCRKLKRDLQSELTETSLTGAALSVVAALVMVGLVVAEFNSYMTTTVGIYPAFSCVQPTATLFK